MRVNFYGPVLFVKDIQVSKEFYIHFFQLKIQHDFGRNVVFEGGLSLWQPDPKHEIVVKHPFQYNGGVRFELYFESDDLKFIEDKLTQYGVTFLHDIKEESWGQYTFRFYDPDQHLVEVGETMPAFVQRMANQGMTKEQIANKTGIPLNDLKKYVN